MTRPWDQTCKFLAVTTPWYGQADWDDVAKTEASKLKDGIAAFPAHSSQISCKFMTNHRFDHLQFITFVTCFAGTPLILVTAVELWGYLLWMQQSFHQIHSSELTQSCQV